MKAINPATKTPAQAPLNKKREAAELFGKENFRWMLLGVAVMILGFILMAGGQSDNPAVFNKEEVYSTRRITIAPIIILAGLVIEIIAIFRQPKTRAAE